MASRRTTRARQATPSPLTAFADTSARVVQTAAEILEEELAAGIAAAKQVGQGMRATLQGSPHLSTADYSSLAERFRTDAHDLLEVFVTLFKTATETVTEVAKAAGVAKGHLDRADTDTYRWSGVEGRRFSVRQVGPKPRPHVAESEEPARKDPKA